MADHHADDRARRPIRVPPGHEAEAAREDWSETSAFPWALDGPVMSEALTTWITQARQGGDDTFATWPFAPEGTPASQRHADTTDAAESAAPAGTTEHLVELLPTRLDMSGAPPVTLADLLPEFWPLGAAPDAVEAADVPPSPARSEDAIGWPLPRESRLAALRNGASDVLAGTSRMPALRLLPGDGASLGAPSAIVTMAMTMDRVPTGVTGDTLAPASGTRPRPARHAALERFALVASGVVLGVVLTVVAGRRDVASPPATPSAAAASAVRETPHPPEPAHVVAQAAVVTQSPASTPVAAASRAASSTAGHGGVVPRPHPARPRPPARPRAAAPRPRPAPPAALEAVRAYATAYSRMDARATQAVWPTADRGTLAATFNGLREQQLTLSGCAGRMVETGAAVSCRGTLRYRPRLGDHSTRTRQGTWQFALAPDGERWRIEGVTEP